MLDLQKVSLLFKKGAGSVLWGMELIEFLVQLTQQFTLSKRKYNEDL